MRDNNYAEKNVGMWDKNQDLCEKFPNFLTLLLHFTFLDNKLFPGVPTVGR